ncbi:MAG: ABC transporter permease, partial [Pseudomonadota bacterium]
MQKMPQWADVFLIPLISLMIAFFLSGLVILAIGESPIEAVQIM